MGSSDDEKRNTEASEPPTSSSTDEARSEGPTSEPNAPRDAQGGNEHGGDEPPAALAVPTRRRRQMGIYDVLLMLVLLVTWLGPITWVGATKKETPYLDDFPWLRHQHRISCLFTNEVKGWQTYELQVQRGGSTEWETMSEKNYFELPVFGYRTRLHRVLGHSYKRGKGAQRLREVGQYIKQRYDELNPGGPPLDAVRFVRIYMTNEMLAKQTGRFKPMKPAEVPKTYALYFGELRFDGKRPIHGGWGLTAAATEERNKPKPQPAKAPTQQ